MTGRAAPGPGERLYRRSPHLLVELEGAELRLVHCDTLRRFRVDENLLDVLRRLDDWRTPRELGTTGRPLSEEELSSLVELGVVEEHPGQPRARDYWDGVELLVQRRHNVGGSREEQLREREDPPPPAFKPRPPGPSTSLPEPRGLPVALDDVLAARRSVRTYADRPLPLEDLSDLLHHSARVVDTAHDELLGELVFRPFAAGGARSELELYVVASDVQGLPPGVHHYDPRAHDLVRIRDRDTEQASLLETLHAATGHALNRDPQLVLLITAVYARMMWKYEGIALAMIYRNTGCLYQTLYLTATALGLAPCGIGGGPELGVARWLGMDPLIESPVGCFLVGTR